MNRRIAAWVVAAVTMLSLAACSGGSDAPEEPTGGVTSAAPEPTTEEPAEPTEEAGGEQSVALACASMAGPIGEAGERMAELAEVESGDPQTVVDTWTALVDAFDSISGTVTNAEVLAAASAVHEDITTLRDAMQTVYVDEDLSAMSDYVAAATSWQESYSALMTLCSTP